MRISANQMAELAMRALSASRGAAAELKVGTIVRATLLEFLNEGDVMVGIGNTKLRAKLDANLQVGDRVSLLVTGEQKQGAMELKLVSPPVRGGQEKAADIDAGAVLRALQVPEGEAGKALVREFLGRGVPLRADVLQAATTVLQGMQPPTAAHLKTLGKMAELGIPIHQSAFEAVHALDEGPKLHELLGRVQELAKGALADEAGPNRTAADNLTARPLPAGAEQAAQQAKTAGTGGLSENTRQQLAQLANTVGQLLQDAEQVPLGDKAKQLGLGFEERLANAMRRLPPDSDGKVLSAALQTVLEVDQESGPPLKQALLQLQAAAAELEAAGHRALADDLGNLLRHVTGQQVMQTAGQERADLMYQFAAVPVRVGNQEQTVELHVMSRKGKGQKSIDPANCYILFRLDMPNLGEIDIHLHIVEKVVGLRFLTDDPQVIELGPAEQRELRDKLTDVGFHLGVLKVEEKKEAEAGATRPLLPPVLTQGALDLKL